MTKMFTKSETTRFTTYLQCFTKSFTKKHILSQNYLQNSANLFTKYFTKIFTKYFTKKEHHFPPPNSLIFIGFIGFVIWFKVRVEAFDKRFGPRLLTAFWSISWSILWTICRSISQRTLGWLTCSHNWNQFEKKSQFFCAPFGVRFSCCKPHNLKLGNKLFHSDVGFRCRGIETWVTVRWRQGGQQWLLAIVFLFN